LGEGDEPQVGLASPPSQREGQDSGKECEGDLHDVDSFRGAFSGFWDVTRFV
jgi:hypothetical protein